MLSIKSRRSSLELGLGLNYSQMINQKTRECAKLARGLVCGVCDLSTDAVSLRMLMLLGGGGCDVMNLWKSQPRNKSLHVGWSGLLTHVDFVHKLLLI